MAVGLTHRLAGWFGWAFLQLVAKTSFVYRIDDPAFLGFRRHKRSGIYSFWHRNQVFLAYEHRKEPIAMMVSQSSDGEYIAQVLHRMGIVPVRGSTTRGGMAALRDLCRRLKGGSQAGFTPDGPRGPVQTVHGGVVEACRLSGAPVLPMAVASRRKLVFRSWDRLFVPLPFSTIVVAHGKPFTIDRNASDSAARNAVRAALNEITDVAETSLRRAPAWPVSFSGAVLGAIYQILAVVFLPVLALALLFRFGLKKMLTGMRERLGAPALRPTETGRKRYWLHAASLGEWQALKPLLVEIKKRPDISVVITVSTPDARVLVARDEPGIHVRLLPLDFTVIARRFVRRVRPDVAIFVETEIWPALFRALQKRHVPLFIANARLGDKGARRWKLAAPLARRLMATVSGVLARTQLDAQRYVSLGVPVERVRITGNTKSDNLRIMPENERIERRTGFFGSNEGVYLIGGSTWPGEEEALLAVLGRRAERRRRVILAPRRTERFEEVARLLESRPCSWSRWSVVRNSRDWTTDVLLVDTLGDLSGLYGAADVAFIGGSLAGRGGQNPLEPAAAGLAILFGASMENFADEARDLLKAGGARRARHPDDLLADAEDVMENESVRIAMGDAARKMVAGKLGAAARTLDAIDQFLSVPAVL